MERAEHPARKPVIGITADIAADKFQVSRAYAGMIERAGGVPIILPCVPSLADELFALCDGVVLSGGDDPIMTQWGVAMHPKARPLDAQRQAFELALLGELDRRPGVPALGVCLGMQLMGLHCGGALDQHLPDSLATADMHWDRSAHEIEGELGRGTVHSHHRQALSEAGSLKVIARAPDGVIEAVRNENRPAMYLGVQWHPERTDDERLGFALFQRLVREAETAAAARGGA
jgi:putative glutamine amidotransferase